MKLNGVSGVLSVSVIAGILGGCASDHQDRLLTSKRELKQSLNQEAIYRNYYNRQKKEEKRYTINAKGTWVHTLVKRIARKKHIPIDASFIPSDEYRIYAKGKYSFNELLDMIRKQTGVNYIVDDGYLKVKNKAFVDQYFSAGSCSQKGASRFTLSLKDAPLKRIFGYFIEKKGYTVEYDLHNHTSIDEFHPTSFSYRGCSVRDALQRIAKANDLKIVYSKGKMVTVKDYDTLKAQVPSYYNLSYSSTSNSLGETKGAGTKLTDKVSAEKEFQAILKGFMSKNGKAYVSNRGYLIVEDKPSYIKRLKKILQKEVGSQQNIDLDVTIVAVELNDQYSSGVDWQKILEPSLNGYKVGFGITSKIGDNAFNISHLSNDGTESVLQLLGEYGNTKIVKRHHLSTRSGILSTLKAVEIIPYVEETSQLNGTTSQIQRQAKSVESGIIMNIKPTLDGNKVNLNVDIMVSEYLGDKEFTDGFKLPMIKTNTIQSPLSVKLGDTTLLTGITTNDTKITYSGLPNMHKTGDLGILTGKNEDGVKRTEYLIFIHPTRARR